MPLPSHLDSDFNWTIKTEENDPKRTLLVVDDEEGPRHSLRIVFRDEYHVLLAESGEQALQMAREQTVDAAVLDIRMTGMSGTELLERLKQIDPAIEVVMLTAYETVESARQSLRYGACDYLNKPFDISTMRTAVHNAMVRRSLSEEIRAKNQKLQQLQAEMQNHRLEEEMVRTKGQIYASIIHDINGPLTIISGFIDIINQRIHHSSRLEGPDMDLVKDRLARITRQVNNCIEISRRYLSLLKEKNHEKKGVSVNQILNDLAELLNAHPSSRNHHLAVPHLEEDILVEANGTDLLQILLNLSVNALQCTSEAHRVEIQPHRVPEPLDLGAMQNGPQDQYLIAEGFTNQLPMIAFAISDDGPGIPSGLLEKIFKPFLTTKSSHQGTGLGLAIVERLLKEARGVLHVHTEQNVGSTFTLYFSAREAAQPA